MVVKFSWLQLFCVLCFKKFFKETVTFVNLICFINVSYFHRFQIDKIMPFSMEHHALQNVCNCWNTNISYYLETSGGQNCNLNVAQFSTPVLIRHLWQLMTVVLLHRCWYGPFYCTNFYLSAPQNLNQPFYGFLNQVLNDRNLLENAPGYTKLPLWTNTLALSTPISILWYSFKVNLWKNNKFLWYKIHNFFTFCY